MHGETISEKHPSEENSPWDNLFAAFDNKEELKFADVPESTKNPETMLSAEQEGSPERKKILEQTYEKARKSPGVKAVVATALAVLIVASGSLILSETLNNGDKTQASGNDPSITTIAPEQEKSIEGIYDGYGEKGMWLSENKGGKYDFASASEVAEICENDECEMIKYTAHNQVESFADYLANLPKGLQPEGFKGLTLSETEQKLESLSDLDYEGTEQQFGDIMDRAFTRRITISGQQHNALMRQKENTDEIVHDNMELVYCTTDENNLEVTQFYWVDENGNEIGSMNVKMTPVYDEDGNIIGFKGCEQVVTDKPDAYADLPEIPVIPPEDPTPERGWGKTGDPHGGQNVTPSDQVDPKSEVTEEKNDSANQGNQGGASVSPGSSSGDTSNQDRKPGGENQGGSGTNGQNPYRDENALREGEKVDQTGNSAQEAAQTSGGENGGGAAPGGDNYSDSGEEDAVKNGDF